MILIIVLFYLAIIYVLNRLFKNLNFEHTSHEMR
jgi:hypothetical protein